MSILRNGVVSLMATSLVAACAAVTAPAASYPARLTGVEQAAADAIWQSEEDRFLNNDPPPVDPINHLIWREVHCQFLLGELSGDAELDKGVDEGMEQLQCRKVVVDGRRLRFTPGISAEDAARLDALVARYAF